MSGVQRGVTNAFGLPAISAATTDSRRPRYGLPWQLFFNVTDKVIYYDDGTSWQTFLSGSGSGLTFGSGLTQLGSTVTNDLTTGKTAGNSIYGFDDDFAGPGLSLWSASTGGINNNYIKFGSYLDNHTAYFSNTGAWNFGAETDPTLTTPYTYAFQERGIFNAQWDFNASIKLLNTNGSHIQSAWQASAPSGNASQTHLFFDSVGSPSFRIGTNNWFKFTPNTLTANRNYALQDSNYTLAGIDIAQTYTALQTFNSGATFGAAINAIAGSAATASINFGTTNTGIYGDASNVRITIGGTLSATISLASISSTYFVGSLRPGATNFINTTVSLTNFAGAGAGTITNAPAAGNPTKWISINDNGTTRYIPCW